jgi:uncharacterized protein (TIGR03067 family)
MKRYALAGGLLVAAFAGVVLADEKALKELEGKYTVTHMEKGGKVAEKEKVDSVKIAITGDEIAIQITRDGEKQEHKAKLKADAAKTPHTIDISPTEGDSKGKTFPGIYKIEKGEVTLVFTEEGDRPKEFKSEGQAMLIKMKKNPK